VPQQFYRILCILGFAVATASFLAELQGYRVAGGLAHLDKLAHFIIFAVLSGLLWKGFKLRLIPAFIVLSGYGAAIELAQHYFTRRNGDWLDFIADIVGVISFYLCRALWHRIRPRRLV
jgi:VanZ family protein